MALNSIAYTETVVGSFLRYHLIAYPFAAPGPYGQMRQLLSLVFGKQAPADNQACLGRNG